MGKQVLFSIQDSKLKELANKDPNVVSEYLSQLILERMNHSYPSYQDGIFISHYSQSTVVYIVDGNYGVQSGHVYPLHADFYDRNTYSPRPADESIDDFIKNARRHSKISIRQTTKDPETFPPAGEKYHLFGILVNDIGTLWKGGYALNYMLNYSRSNSTDYVRSRHHRGIFHLGSYHHNQGIAVLMSRSLFLPFIPFSTKNGMELKTWEKYKRLNPNTKSLTLYTDILECSKESLNALLAHYGYRAK